MDNKLNPDIAKEAAMDQAHKESEKELKTSQA